MHTHESCEVIILSDSDDEAPAHVLKRTVRQQENSKAASQERQTEFLYRVVYVPDPTHCKSLKEVLFELCFLDTRIHQNEWDAVKHLKDSVHLISGPSRSKGMVRVYMDEWVCLNIIKIPSTHDWIKVMHNDS
jgi:hypothetical protein